MWERHEKDGEIGKIAEVKCNIRQKLLENRGSFCHGVG